MTLKQLLGEVLPYFQNVDIDCYLNNDYLDESHMALLDNEVEGFELIHATSDGGKPMWQTDCTFIREFALCEREKLLTMSRESAKSTTRIDTLNVLLKSISNTDTDFSVWSDANGDPISYYDR